MKINEITAAMQLWSNERNQAGLTKMTNWLNQGNMFSYQRDSTNQPIPPTTLAYVHAYPGILTNNNIDTLCFFVISAYKDVSSNTNIAADIQVCKTSTGQPSPTSTGAMPTQEAFGRIQAWKNGHNAWIQQNISSPNSIFSAFVIPQDDTSFGSQHDSFLALNPDSSAPGGYKADLIIENVDGNTIEYFDTVLPCPPFFGGITEESKFYLLSLV